MARAISDDELQLKRRARRRLIGAIVLVVAIVVVLPMVLDSEPKQTGQVVSVQIPSPEAGVFNSKAPPLPAAATSKSAAKAALPADPPAMVARQPAPEPPSPSKAMPARDTPKAEQKEASSPAVKTETATLVKPAAKKAKPDGKFVVQVIALADAAKAKRMQESIAAAGIKSYTEVVKTSKGDVTRVRAGPFATRGAADKAREQLKALGMNGNVTTK